MFVASNCNGSCQFEALKLHEAAGVDISGHGSTLEDVDRFAKHLDVQINIIDEDYFNKIIHTSNPNADKMIYLHKNKNHYNVITSMPAFLCKDYYCHTCKKGYNCDKCNRTFFGQKCYEEHLKNRSKGKKRDVFVRL